MNILEPLDPLNISFSEDKCVRTPVTLSSARHSPAGTSSPGDHDHRTPRDFPALLVKDPEQLFGSPSARPASGKETLEPTHAHTCRLRKYEDVFTTPVRSPRLEVHSWSRRHSHHKPARNIGLIPPSEHVMEIRKLDSLIRRINGRIESSRKIVP